MSDEETMVERVAKAIYDVTSVDDVTLPWERAKAGQRELHMEWAQAAIEAMRTPTPSMEDAVAKDVDDWVSERIEDMMHLYKVAIDAALKEPET